MIPADLSAALADHDTAAEHTEWGVLSYSPRLGRHVVDEHPDHDTAQAGRDRIRHTVDMAALLVHREVRTGRWTPDTTHGGAA